ncbi:protein angel homolog 1 [Genypterus blacodes]|uniref:protein angel homolog 1 n=1 Tax=Genypterus blacodes TaxID=154954 RepID=UPI003F771DF7
MIGTLLFYALYPLTRLLGSWGSDVLKKRLSPAQVNGKAVWDGVGAPTRRFEQSQTAPLDQRLDPGPGSSGEMGKGMKAQSPGKEGGLLPDVDKEERAAGLCESERLLETDEVQRAEMEKEAETHDGNQEDTVKISEQDIQQTTAQANVSPVTGPQEPLAYGDRKPAEDDTPATVCPLEEQTTQLIIDESNPSAEAPAEEAECWDTCVGLDPDGASSPSLALSFLLSDGPTEDSGFGHDQPAWHFPAGPGLAQELQCPLWQFPTMSYYPTLKQADPFEVTWRLWEEVDEGAAAAPLPFPKVAFDFTVMSYNILAQDLLEAHQELYTHCPLEVLEWSYRCSLLLKEIQKWVPDILCLQEVQEDHYHDQLHPALSQMGYTCVYKRRTGDKTDGCASCYRGDRFSEISITALEFFRPETELLDRHNVGIVLLLRPVVPQGSKVKGPPLCVANTHLLFNPRRGDVKLAQLGVMLAEMDSVFRSCKAGGEHCNVVLCGDFNSVPNAPLYQLITTRQLFYNGLPAWAISGQENLWHQTQCYRLFAPLWPSSLGIGDNCQYTVAKEMLESSGKHQYSRDFLLQLRFCPAACVRPVKLEQIPGVTDDTPDASKENQSEEQRFRTTISHRLDLQSAYTHVLPGSGQSEVTTLHSKGAATVDYIFYSPKRPHSDLKGLTLLGCLSLPSEDVLWSINGLPSHIFPSDHLSLLTNFQLLLDAE